MHFIFAMNVRNNYEHKCRCFYRAKFIAPTGAQGARSAHLQVRAASANSKGKAVFPLRLRVALRGER